MQNQDFNQIRASRIEKEQRLIQQSKELEKIKIEYINTDLGTIIRVQIPVTQLS